MIQVFSDKIDKNGDRSLSAKELSVLPFETYSYCYDNYRKTGWEYCKLAYGAWDYDQDENNEIFGVEMCDFWKDLVDTGCNSMFETTQKRD